MEKKLYENDGNKVSIYCSPYMKAQIDFIAKLFNLSVYDAVDWLLNVGINEVGKEAQQKLNKPNYSTESQKSGE